MVFDAIPDIKRLAELGVILSRYGFGHVLQQAGVGDLLGTSRDGAAVSSSAEERASHNGEPGAATRLRLALEEMGPTFVKLGQILSTRADLLPAEYVAELEKLRDNAPTLPFDTLAQEAEGTLGQKLAEIFAEVDRNPLAAGSIAQVHKARLATGEKVVLKLRRPGIEAVIDADLRLLAHAARLVSSHNPEWSRYRPEEIVAEFARSLRQELDLAEECRNAERIAANFADTPHIRVPQVYWDWTNACMNVQERVEGVPGSDLAAVRAAGLDLKRLARRGAEAVLNMILRDGLFHADPHGGNVFFLPGETLVFIDFGMVGHVSQRRRDELIDLTMAFVERDAAGVVRVLLHWARSPVDAKPELEDEVDRIIGSVHGVSLQSLDISEIAFELIALMREHELTLPPDLTLMVKAFVSLEGMGRQLDPEFDVTGAAAPLVQHVLLQRHSPEKIAKAARRGLTDGARFLTTLPGDLQALVQSARKGDLTLKIGIPELDQVLTRIETAIAQLTLGLVIAALIIGSSIVMAVSGTDLPVGLSIFAMGGFFGAVLGGAWLVFSIWRSRKRGGG